MLKKNIVGSKMALYTPEYSPKKKINLANANICHLFKSLRYPNFEPPKKKNTGLLLKKKQTI